jgi:hypothetical protein
MDMKKLKIFLFLSMVMLFGQACKKNNLELGDYLGTAICVSDNFAYINNFKVNGSTAPVPCNFRAAPYYASLTADLNEVVTWTITITGQTSGAIKTFTQTSKTVNVKWYGNSDADVFFKAGEIVSISFLPSCDEAVVVPLTISNSAIFNFYGSLMVDFDNVGSVYTYNSTDPNIGPTVRNIDTLLTEVSPQGGRCHKAYGPKGHTGWYIGGFGQTVDLSTVLGAGLKSENTYVNIYMRGALSGIPDGTTVSLDMVETVSGKPYHFKKNVVINWRGWKMVTFKLSDLYIGDPNKVASLDFSVGPALFNDHTEAYVDFVIFTKDKPFLGPN